jgi:hypothetical protein
VEELFAETADEPESVDLEIEYREPAQPGDAGIVRAGRMMWITAPDGAVCASVAGLPG